MAEELEFDPLTWAVKEAARHERKSHIRTAPGPDLSREACACGAFGPWGNGTEFFCAKHVPPDLRFAGQFFSEMMDE